MNTSIVKISTVIMMMVGLTGCSLLQRESPEKKARELVAAFEQSLSKSDDEVLKFFDTDQSSESLLAAINLLQHEDSELVECVADFNRLSLEVESQDESTSSLFQTSSSLVKVTLPITVKAREGDASANTELVFRLKEKEGQWIIYQLEGDNFYQAFTSMKNDIQFAQHRLDEIKEREAIYAMADSLRNKYDHVVWYAQYGGEVYFYVVSGDWNEEALYSNNASLPEFKMGLVNSAGKEIIPVEFNMIGTLAAEVENAVEVKGPYGYGYFSLNGDTLVSPNYSQIIPLPDLNSWIVQSEGQFGWVDENKNYKDGFPNREVEEKINQFTYLPAGIKIAEGSYALCETPNRDAAGSGVFITPSYWVVAGLLEPFKSGITTTVTDAPIGGWTEYIELGETFFQSITNNLGVVIASFKERYLEGREEFYEHKKLLFKDSLQSTVLSTEFSGENLEVKKVSDDLVEVRSIQGIDDDYFGGMPRDGELQGEHQYKYYRFDDYSLTELSSNRGHPETEFVKLDDSYISGDFRIYNGETVGWESASVYSLTYLLFMRNEILASYGVNFKDPEELEYFKRFTWYSPRYNSEAEIQDALSEVDRHNLDFLKKAINDLQNPEGDV